MQIIPHFRQSIIASILILCPAVGMAEDTGSYTLSDNTVVAPLDMFRECDQCPEMIAVPLGSFMMGATPEESRNPFDAYGENATGRKRGPDELNIIPSEHPRHPVDMDIPYAMGRNEVTHAEWMACVDAGGCSYTPEHWVLTPRQGEAPLGPDHPVIKVSYLDVLDYVAWLNDLVGADVYRLPTESEWEYAARAGTTTRFAQGDDLTSAQANFSRGATEGLRLKQMPELISRYLPVPVDTLDAANGWGLRHMSGNVREWTQSCYTSEHIGLASDSAYLQLAQSQNSCRRTAKGGAFSSAMDLIRPSSRARPEEIRRTGNLGFRILREL